jgi:hypothetical protein
VQSTQSAEVRRNTFDHWLMTFRFPPGYDELGFPRIVVSGRPLLDRGSGRSAVRRLVETVMDLTDEVNVDRSILRSEQ